MYITYFDETGDDGFPEYSSELFILTSLYMHYQSWQSNYKKIADFRRWLKKEYNFPIKLEFHTKKFLTDKNPYRQFNWTKDQITNILFELFKLISLLDLKVVNVCINKRNINNLDYDVLDKALTYNIQRIENDLNKKDSANKFLIITDEGRVGKMRRVTRRIQRINFIPSQIYPRTAYRKEIEGLIEDPLPKSSDESYFIQLADAISYIIFLYALKNYNNSKWANRILNKLRFSDVIKLLDIITDKLNIKASKKDPYGVVHYPT